MGQNDTTDREKKIVEMEIDWWVKKIQMRKKKEGQRCGQGRTQDLGALDKTDQWAPFPFFDWMWQRVRWTIYRQLIHERFWYVITPILIWTDNVVWFVSSDNGRKWIWQLCSRLTVLFDPLRIESNPRRVYLKEPSAVSPPSTPACHRRRQQWR